MTQQLNLGGNNICYITWFELERQIHVLWSVDINITFSCVCANAHPRLISTEETTATKVFSFQKVLHWNRKEDLLTAGNIECISWTDMLISINWITANSENGSWHAPLCVCVCVKSQWERDRERVRARARVCVNNTSNGKRWIGEDV